MRTLSALAALLFLATFAPASLYRAPGAPARTILSFTPVPLDETDPARRTVGWLTYLGGWAIRSNDARFGGISAMHVRGRTVTAVSDAGWRIVFEPLAKTGAISSLTARAPRIGGRSEHDVEAMAVAGDRAWLSLERRNEVLRFEGADWRPAASARPATMRKWPGNSGGEAMLRLADGRFLLFAEAQYIARGTTEVLLFDGDPTVPGTKAMRLGYRPPKGYQITDAALLPDGRALFLNRRFTLLGGFTAKLTLGRLDDLKAGAILTGEEIAFLRPPLAVDNMEALSITEEGGRTILWLASDDNLNSLQRTLLLRFALDP